MRVFPVLKVSNQGLAQPPSRLHFTFPEADQGCVVLDKRVTMYHLLSGLSTLCVGSLVLVTAEWQLFGLCFAIM